jgi:hypothetical protein
MPASGRLETYGRSTALGTSSQSKTSANSPRSGPSVRVSQLCAERERFRQPQAICSIISLAGDCAAQATQNTMRSFLIATSLLVVLLPPAFLASTPVVKEAVQANVPDVPLLRARVKEFWRAVGVHDIVKRYEMTTPTVRERVTLEAFKKTWSWQEQPEFPVQNITADLAGVCSCVELRLLRCTVAVDLTIERPGEPPRDEHTLQTWEFGAGQWYEAYSGAPIGRRCPREG